MTMMMTMILLLQMMAGDIDQLPAARVLLALHSVDSATGR